MKQNILRFCISILLFAVSFSANAQEEETPKDSIKLNDKYGLRIGLDISRPIISLFNDDFKGFELVGDFRMSKNYIKLGVNYNLYQNWGKMSNEIFAGVRYGFSTFSQTLNTYNPNFDGTYFPELTVDSNTEFSDLNAHWAELVMGLKVEVFHNLYLGTSMSLKKMIRQKQPKNFENLYIPGFERVYLNETGFSFNYTVSYLIPIYKKE
jgi:hypothetical protein